MDPRSLHFGPKFIDGAIEVLLWAPEKKTANIIVHERKFEMKPLDKGFWKIELDLSFAGSSYAFVLDNGSAYPDPASRFLPEGIFGQARICNPSDYRWNNDSWSGLSLTDYIIEETHVGTFTAEGTFKSMEQRLDHLKDTGVTAVEIMPVAEFYGRRNWGYDGVYIFSPHYTYGTPENLKHLVDEIHSRGMCAILDVVYNHGGPIGNFLGKFGPYYSSRHRSMWGSCFNFDGEYSEIVREFVLQNVVYWLDEFRFDALRLDAVQGILDDSPKHILKDMAERVNELARERGRKIYLIAESDQNDYRLTRRSDEGGFGIDAQWNDDFHHSLHVALTGEVTGYYKDYAEADSISRVLRNGFLFEGQYSQFLKRNRGSRWGESPKYKLVVFSQNHDQVGNRAHGERLLMIAGEAKARLAAAITLMSPFTPLLFMGEEFGADSPFLFFIDTDDKRLARAVYDGRLKEFSAFGWNRDTPDPNELNTFTESRIRWPDSVSERGRKFIELYRDLIVFRKRYDLGKERGFSSSESDDGVLAMQYDFGLYILCNLTKSELMIRELKERREILLDTEWEKYGGSDVTRSESLEPYSARIYLEK